MYAVKLNVKNRLCVVVGGGRAAYIKARRLIGEGAKTRIIAERFSRGVETLPAERLQRPFAEGDLDGAFLVFALTDSAEVNRYVAAAARKRGVIIGGSDFDVLASKSGEHITAAVGTGFPLLSAKLVGRLLEYDGLCGVLAEYRERVKAEGGETERPLKAAVTDEMLALWFSDKDEYKKRLNFPPECANI